jgi:hypothetical protein
VTEPFTRVTLFVPGVPSSAVGWNEALQRGGLRIENGVLRGGELAASPEVEWVENDGAFGQAFSFSNVGRGVIEAVEAAPSALVLHWPIDLRDGRQTIVAAVERLRHAGAIAVRLEQSKLGWDVSRWLELFSSINAWDWHRGAVTLLEGDRVLQSCGMHAFSLPDVQVHLDSDQFPLAELASTLNVYQLAEDPILRSGQTFTPARDVPRRVAERWPDTRYPAEHACHNPYGVWRLGTPGGSARKLQELVFTFIPALQVLLTALEQKRGKPLTRDEVEAARDQGACIAMEPRDAQKLERERGYSDLDPELAWEQWKLARRQA